MLDHLRQIAIFAKAVDHGSFRAAARALDISPSVVSHHISELEKRLGVALLYRSTRKLSVTEDGKRLLAGAHAMIAAAEAGLNAVAGGGGALSGVLNVTIPAVMAQSALVDRIAAFAQAHPNVSLSLDFSDMRREVISDGIDVAIRMGWLQDSALKARKLGEVSRALVASRSYFEAQTPPVAPAELEGWRWLELSPVRRKTEFRQSGATPVQIDTQPHIRVNDAHAMYRLSRAGAGLAFLPRFLVEDDLASGAMVHVLPDWSVEPVGVFAVWPPNAPKAGLTAQFVEAVSAGE